MQMWWYGRDKKVSISESLERAVAHYKKKYGTKFVICYVHKDVDISKLAARGLIIKHWKYVLPNHFLLEEAHETI